MHRPAQVGLAGLHQQRRVVVPQHVGQQPQIEAIRETCQQRGEGPAVALDKEHQATCVRPYRHVAGVRLEQLKEELLAPVSERVGAQPYGAERLVNEGLAAEGWAEEDPGRRRKGDPGKLRLARRLRGKRR